MKATASHVAKATISSCFFSLYCCVYRSKTDCLALINSDCPHPLSTLLFSSSDPSLVSRVNNRPTGLSSLVTGPRSEGPEEVKSKGGWGAEAET